MKGAESNLTATGQCCYANNNNSVPANAVGSIDPSTGMKFDHLGGNGFDNPNGIMFAEVGGHGERVNPNDADRITDEDYDPTSYEEWVRIGKPGRSYLNWRSKQEDGACKSGGSSSGKSAKDEALDGIILVLDVLGFVPEAGAIADSLAAGLELAKDDADKFSAALSGLAAAMSIIAPLVGDAAVKPVKWAWKAGKRLNIGKLAKKLKELGKKAADSGCEAMSKAWKKIQDWWKKLIDFLDKHSVKYEGESSIALAGAGGPNVKYADNVSGDLAKNGKSSGGGGTGGAGSKDIPGNNNFAGKDGPKRAYKHLEKHHGVSPEVASARLHKIKESAGLGAADDVIIGRTGDVYDSRTGEHVGSLTDKGLGSK